MDESAPSAATGTAGAQRLIQKGAEIAGGAFASLAGTATGLVVAGPEGALVGGAAGSSITMALRWLGQEMSSRLLGPREEQRLGYVFTLAAAEIAKRINAGEQVRQDEFFNDNPSGRSEGEEVWESILMKSQREPEEKKLPYTAHLLASLAFDPGIGSHMAHQVTKTAEQLTYRQLCILKLIMVKEQYALRENDYRKAGGTFPAELYQLFYEYYDLHNRGYINSGTGTMLGLTDLNPSAVKLQGLGFVTFHFMRLSAIPEADVLPIVEQLK